MRDSIYNLPCTVFSLFNLLVVSTEKHQTVELPMNEPTRSCRLLHFFWVPACLYLWGLKINWVDFVSISSLN